MKIFYSENTVDYTSYTFNYAIYCQKESQEELDEIYHKGFLPYTGNINLEKELFYLARSLRVNLSEFKDSSENRRVGRMVEPLEIELLVHKKEDFLMDNKFCEAYITERIGEENMSLERWEYIKSQNTGTHVFEFKNKDHLFGYVFASVTDKLVHYWFAFFDTNFMRSHSLGKYMMWAIINWSKENGKEYTYLGTAYKPTALYKIRDHKALQFFDGKQWNNDSKLLKKWCETDMEDKPSDRFKQIEEPNTWLENE